MGDMRDGASLIKTARLQAGLTQAELAKRAGMTQPVVAAYEAGRREPTLPMLRKLLGAAGYVLDTALRRSLDDNQIARELEALLELADTLPRRYDQELHAPIFRRP